MCTAATYRTKDHYFGRTLDYEFSYGEEVTLTPRNYPLRFRHTGTMEHHHAILGMAYVEEGYPLYFDGMNEKGLAMAGLNFVGHAHYRPAVPGRENVAQYEFIPWILARCDSVAQARKLLEEVNLTLDAFSPALPPAQLHWMIADREEAITVESVREGLRIYDNPGGVLTNNPPFDIQLYMLRNYMHLSPQPPQNRFSDALDLHSYSRGMGAIGLPGDLSSQSRFVRAAFVRLNSVSGESEGESVSQFFHILGAVEVPMGCCALENGEYERTIYTSCCNTDRGIYYYRTYDNHAITGVDMHRENLDGEGLIRYPQIAENRLQMQN